MSGVFAAADPGLVTAITGGATSVQENVVAVGTAVLPVAAVIVALTLGWRFAKGFIRG